MISVPLVTLICEWLIICYPLRYDYYICFSKKRKKKKKKRKEKKYCICLLHYLLYKFDFYQIIKGFHRLH